MIHGWLIYDAMAKKVNESYIHWFIAEAQKQEVELQLVLREEITFGIEHGEQVIYLNGRIATPPKFVIIRTIETTLQYYFEHLSIRTFNDTKTAMICNHKSKTYIKINKLQVPMVPTYFMSRASLPATLPLDYPFVVKEATGRGGKEVFYITSQAEWQEAVKQLTSNDFLIQSATVILGRDVRVFVIGKEIIGAVLRKNDADFRANYTLGGQAIPYVLEKSERKMIQSIIDQFDFGLVGIDFLIDQEGRLVFNEIEDVVGSRILSKVSDINLLEKYVTFIKDTVMQKSDSLPMN